MPFEPRTTDILVESGMKINFDYVDELMCQAIRDNVFPGGVLLVSIKGSIKFFQPYGVANIFTKVPVTADTIFDLASLTKPLATTLAIMRLVQQFRLDLEQSLGSVLVHFKNTEKETIKISQLLRHTAGLPDYIPFYIELNKLPFEERKEALKQRLVRLPLQHPIGEKVLYSDPGFMILGQLVEDVCGQRLDHFLTETVYRPLGLTREIGLRLCFVDLTDPVHFERIAATAICPWRQVLIEGVVHDDNAYAVGGIAGHAGLFGNAEGVYVLIEALLSAFYGRASDPLFPADLLRIFLQWEKNTSRPLGFDAPSLQDSSCGQYFSKHSAGHLGFTGTSFWVDLERDITVILLTNRVHPTQDNDAIKIFRPKIHDAVMEKLLA